MRTFDDSPSRGFEGQLDQQREWSRKIAEVANLAMAGKINATGTFTLTANALTTVVKDTRCGPDSVILLCPTTESAGGEVGMWFSNRGVEVDGRRSFTVNHGFDSRTDRTFSYCIFA